MKRHRHPGPLVAPTSIAALLALLLSACGGGDANDHPASASASDTRSTKASVSAEPSGTACAFGGSRIDAGIDLNHNGVLDASEVTSTQYACNGTPGDAGANGADGGTGATGATGSRGAAGADGTTRLVSIETEAAGTHCAQGGSKVSVGTDADGNGVLDSSELTSSAYVCAAANGAPGAAGATGATGAAGHSSLISIAAADRANCAYGGTRVDTGLDANDNGVLDAGEVAATTYNCTGAPGAGVNWTRVTGPGTAMVAGMGYLADSAAPLSLTLPASPTLGDLFSVRGVGAGAWTIAQNAGQSIAVGGMPNNSVAGQSWTLRSTTPLYNLASSADGVRLVGTSSGNQIQTSTDSGATWTPRFDSHPWTALASSSDGRKLVAAADADRIYTSADAGLTWTARDSARQWFALASSSDGTRLVALDRGAYVANSFSGGSLYTSSDSGVTWTAQPNAGVRAWWAVASSSDGAKLVAADYRGQVYTSTDAGVNWATRTGPTNVVALASSADGSRLVAATDDLLYTSTDSGVTWTARNPNNYNWRSVASSTDGKRLVAVNSNGTISLSADGGLSWSIYNDAQQLAWWSVASSASGGKLVAVQVGGGGSVLTSDSEHTSTGTAGSLGGAQFDSVDLQYVGGGSFVVRGYTSTSGRFTVQ